MHDRDDLPRVTGVGHLAMDLWEAHGALALEMADGWADGPPAANLDPDSRGNRWEEIDGEVWPIPNDSTGDKALRARLDLRSEIDGLLKMHEATSVRLRNIVMAMVPMTLASTDDNEKRWCVNHLRIGVCEHRYRGDLCKWCDDKRLEWGVRPPVKLMTMRHLGKTVYDRDVKAALEAEGVRLEVVKGVTKAVRLARGKTGRPNQNDKRAKAG